MDAINHIEITLPIHQIKSSLQILLTAIFFQRTLDTLEPETREIQDLHIACAPAASIDSEIQDRISEFSRKYLQRDEKSPMAGYDRGEIALIFTQKKSRKGWFGITEEIVPWEAHFITIRFSPTTQTPPRAAMTDALVQIISFCAERGGCVPNVGTGESDRLSHQIIISPPPPGDLFAPSPPNPPGRGRATSDATAENKARRSDSPGSKEARDGAMGYLEQAKDVLRATGARAGWTSSGGGKGR